LNIAVGKPKHAVAFAGKKPVSVLIPHSLPVPAVPLTVDLDYQSSIMTDKIRKIRPDRSLSMKVTIQHAMPPEFGPQSRFAACHLST
jgi:hypothetical protein